MNSIRSTSWITLCTVFVHVTVNGLILAAVQPWSINKNHLRIANRLNAKQFVTGGLRLAREVILSFCPIR